MKPRLLWVIVLLVILTPVYSIAYTSLHYNYVEGGVTDPLIYIDMYHGQPVSFEFSYRVMTPYLARLIPNPPAWLFSKERNLPENWLIRVRFAMVNSVFLAVAAMVLFYYLLGFNLGVFESLLGTALFLTCRPVVQFAGLPMVDAAALCFLVLGFLAIQRGNVLLLLCTVLIGVFAKESTFFLGLIVLLTPMAPGRKLQMLLAFVPGMLAYVAFRVLWQPALAFHFWYGFSPGEQMRAILRANGLFDLGSSFGSLWIPAMFGLAAGDVPQNLKRWSWFIVFILAAVFSMDLHLSRELLMAFPVVIPLCLMGIRRFVSTIGYDRLGYVVATAAAS